MAAGRSPAAGRAVDFAKKIVKNRLAFVKKSDIICRVFTKKNVYYAPAREAESWNGLFTRR